GPCGTIMQNRHRLGTGNGGCESCALQNLASRRCLEIPSSSDLVPNADFMEAFHVQHVLRIDLRPILLVGNDPAMLWMHTGCNRCPIYFRGTQERTVVIGK